MNIIDNLQQLVINDFRNDDIPYELIPLRNNLAKALNDYHRANSLVLAFSNHIQKVLPQEYCDLFIRWMSQNAYYLGSRSFDHSLVFKDCPDLHWYFSQNKSFAVRYLQFVLEIVNLIPLNQSLSNQISKVAILYPGQSGGGHRAPAMALKEYLQECNLQVLCIDISEVQDKYSPIVQGYKRSQIYPEIIQKQGDSKKAKELRKLLSEKFYPGMRNAFCEVRKDLEDFGAQYIFSIAHHKPKLATLAYQLNIPMTIVHTDHVFQPKLVKIAKRQLNLKKPLISFTKTSNERLFFANLEKIGEVAIKVIQGLNGKKRYVLTPKMKSMVAPMGIPIRKSFFGVSPEQVRSIREKLGISSDATCAMLTMGQNGVQKEVLSIVQKCIEEKDLLSKPLCVVIVCGKNEELKNAVDELIESVPKEGFLSFLSMGFLDENDMADIAKASDVWVTKPGGSTTSEAHFMEKPVLYVLLDSHKWEEKDAQLLKRVGLGRAYNSKSSIAEQITSLVEHREQSGPIAIKAFNWKENVNAILNL